MEGISMNLRLVLDELGRFCHLADEMVLVGGGSKSALWRQIFADTFNKRVIRTNIGQQAAALGAAAVAAIGTGLWPGFGKIDEVQRIESVTGPLPENVRKYELLLPVFEYVRDSQARTGDLLHQLAL
jgi:xylulokinase